MNNDENNPEKKSQMPAEMEARVVAWALGESTAEEAAAMERLAAGQPEIAAFRKRIEAGRKLVSEAMSPDREVLRLSAGRRAALLQTLTATETAEQAPAEGPNLAVIRRKQRLERQWMLAVAACVTVGLFLSVMVTSSEKSYRTERAYSLAGQEKAEQYKKLRDDEMEGTLSSSNTRKEAREVTITAPGFAEANEPQAVAAEFDQKLATDRLAKADGQPESTGGALVAPMRLEAAARVQQVQVAMPALPEDLDMGRTSGTGAVEIGALSLKPSGGRLAFNEQAPAPAPADTTTTTTTTAVAPATSDQEEPTVLSPFVVEASEDKGSYRANSTLAGTRVRTDLKDISSAINVVTAQFLQDTGARNPDSLLTYGPKADAGPSPGYMPTASGGPEGAVAKLGGVDAPGEDAAGAGGTGFGETSAAKDPVSTFSLHVSDVSFRLALAALARGEAPDPASIRPEEFYNAFNTGDPAPAMADKVSCHTEQAIDPVMQQRNLLRIAMRVPTTGREAAQPLRLTVLLDTSGSMEREDRAAAVHSAMKALVSLLGPDDRVTLIGFARQPRLLADQVPGDKARSLLDLIAHIPAEGGTNLEEGIKVAGDMARRQFSAAAQNRVVLLTDGAANLGDANPASLAALVETLRQQGISFDACGVGTDGIQDSVLEALTRKGSGRYYLLDTPDAADAGFAHLLAGAFRPAAENVKVQVRFNPSRVGSYRLIGFENHRLKREDFRNDAVAAAALAGGEAAVALYEVQVLPQGDGDLGQVYVRFHDTASGAMVERSWPLVYDPNAPAFDRATPTMQLAGTAALLAEKLRGGARGDAIRLAQLAPVVNALRSHYSHEVPVQELATMYEEMRRLHRE